MFCCIYSFSSGIAPPPSHQVDFLVCQNLRIKCWEVWAVNSNWAFWTIGTYVCKLKYYIYIYITNGHCVFIDVYIFWLYYCIVRLFWEKGTSPESKKDMTLIKCTWWTLLMSLQSPPFFVAGTATDFNKYFLYFVAKMKKSDSLENLFVQVYIHKDLFIIYFCNKMHFQLRL